MKLEEKPGKQSQIRQCSHGQMLCSPLIYLLGLNLEMHRQLQMLCMQASNVNMGELCVFVRSVFVSVCITSRLRGQGEPQHSHNYVIKTSDIWNSGAIVSHKVRTSSPPLPPVTVTPPAPQQPAQVCVCISGRGGEKKRGGGSKQVAMAGKRRGIVLNGNSPPFVTDYLSVWPGDEMRTGGGLSPKGVGGCCRVSPLVLWYYSRNGNGIRKPNAVMTQPQRKEREEHITVEEHLINDTPHSYLSLVSPPPPLPLHFVL